MRTCPRCGYIAEVTGTAAVIVLSARDLTALVSARPEPPVLEEVLAPLIEPQSVIYLPPLELPELRLDRVKPPRPARRAPRAPRPQALEPARPWPAALRSWSGR